MITNRIDRLPPHFPRSKRLLTDANSNILVFMTGHGGDNFLKFQDSEEINAYDLADAFEQMWAMGRYNEILFIIDTCQASTMFERFRSPNILAISSSMRGQSSYSYHVDDDIGVAIIDRFTYALLNFLRDLGLHSQKTVGDFMASLDLGFLGSTPELREDLFGRQAADVRLIDFFGNVQPMVLTPEPLALLPSAVQSSLQDHQEASDDEADTLDSAPSLVAESEALPFLAFDITKKPPRPASTYFSGLVSTVGLGLLAASLMI